MGVDTILDMLAWDEVATNQQMDAILKIDELMALRRELVQRRSEIGHRPVDS